MTKPNEMSDQKPITFPYTEHDPLTGNSITLYREADRSSASYRLTRANGSRTPKQTVPKELDKDVRNATTNVVHPELIEWAIDLLVGLRETKDEAQAFADRTRGNRVPISDVFRYVRETEWYAGLSERQRKAYAYVMRWVEAVLGASFLASRFDMNTILRLHRLRTDEGVPSTTPSGGKIWLPPESRNTAAGDIRKLRTILSRATEVQISADVDDYVLESNPLDRFKNKLPKPGVRKPKLPMNERRHEILMRLAPRVDPSGRFEYLLQCLRWCGRRLITIRRMTDLAILTTEAAIRQALDDQLFQYIRDEVEKDRVARLYMQSCGGAVYWRWEWEKSGQSGDEDRVEQYDAVQPVAPAFIRATREFFTNYRDHFNLPPGSPLIPGEDPTKPISHETVYAWMDKAKLLAAKEGLNLGMFDGDGIHGYRNFRRTDFRNVPDKYGRWLVGHSIVSGASGITLSEDRYLSLDANDILTAVRMGKGAL